MFYYRPHFSNLQMCLCSQHSFCPGHGLPPLALGAQWYMAIVLGLSVAHPVCHDALQTSTQRSELALQTTLLKLVANQLNGVMLHALCYQMVEMRMLP